MKEVRNSEIDLLSTPTFDLYEALSNILRLASHVDVQNESRNNNCCNNGDYFHSSNNADRQSYPITDNTLFGLMTSPLLLESSSGEEDMRAIAVGACYKLGICAVTIDARVIFESYTNSMASKEYSTSCPSTFQDKIRPGSCNITDGAFIVQRYSPCLLLIENLDSLIFGGVSTDPNSQAQNEENEFQEIFAIILNKFLTGLWAAVADSTRSKKCSEGASSSQECSIRDHLMNSAVLVAAVTRTAERLKPALRALFPSELDVSPPPDSHVEVYVHEMISRNKDHTESLPFRAVADDDHGSKLSKEKIGSRTTSATVAVEDENLKVKNLVIKIATSLSVEGGVGLSGAILKAVVEEATTYRMQKNEGKIWMKECGLVRKGIRDAAPFVSSSSSTTSPRFPGTAPSITDDDVRKAATSLSRTRLGSGKGDVKVSPVHWSDIGGLDSVRKEILDVLQLPFLRPDLFPAGCSKRRGILLYGPPGTGKTLVARAVATECNMAFVSVKGPELLDVYVGESERNVRELFAGAHRCAPCVLFFDELDSLAPARGRGSDGGGVMDRVVSQLLTEIDRLGIEPATNTSLTPSKRASGAVVAAGVFVIGATNRPDLLDPALLRPGRFDRKIYLSVCKDVSARVQILQAQTRKFILGDDVVLSEIAQLLPDTVTGADIGALSTAAYSNALEKKLSDLRDGAQKAQQIATSRSSRGKGGEASESGATDDAHKRSILSSKMLSNYISGLSNSELTVPVSRDNFLSAVRGIKPSVTRSELDHYEALGKEFNDLVS